MLDDAALDTLFRTARTQRAWLPTPVSTEQLHTLYDLFKLGPTSANASPARVLFCASAESKERLIPAVSPGNVDRVRAAPVTAVVAWDTRFYDQLPRLFPFADMRALFADNAPLAAETALRNSSLQGAYLILAARAIGLDCGPMSGFDAEKLNGEFFPDGSWKANFICTLGYGDHSALGARGPRLEFDEACRIV